MPSIKDLTLLVAAVTASVLISSFFLTQLKKQIPARVAVVDVVGITTEATDAILRGAGTAEDKAKAAEAFSIRLNKEIEQLSRECRCVLLVSAAMISTPENDLTDYVRKAIKR